MSGDFKNHIEVQKCEQNKEDEKGVSEVCSLVEDIAIATHLTEEEINKLR